MAEVDLSRIFYEVHTGLPREGPGDSDSTRKAFSFCKTIHENPSILDIGCGPGAQTLDLQQTSNGYITAIDISDEFLAELTQRAIKSKHVDESQIEPLNMSMFDLQFEPEIFDVIWGEGSIYIIGFEQGLRYWNQFLRSGGYLAVTENSWITDETPPLLRKFWEEACPGMGTIDRNIMRAKSAGYNVVGTFELPEESWWDNYYSPMLDRIKTLEYKYRDNLEALEVLAAEKAEISIRRQYKEFYNYVFYILQKS